MKRRQGFIFLLISLFLMPLSPVHAAAPVSAQAQPLAIFGPDNRVRLADPTSWPARTSVYLQAFFPKLKAGWALQGTGTLIGAETVLTAAHVVYAANLGGLATRVQVMPAYNRGALPYGQATSNRLYLPAGYTAHPDFDQDLAVIKLSSAIGKKTGWLNTAVGVQVGQILTLSGYSGDLNGAVGRMAGPVTSVSGPIATYLMDATPGSSGSGLYDAAGKVRVVHTFETALANGGSVITADRQNWLIGLRNTPTNVTTTNYWVYVTGNRWNRYADFSFRVIGTTATNQIYQVRRLAIAWNGETYAALYNSRGQFMGYTNNGDLRRVTITPVNRTLRIRSRGISRWNNIDLTTRRGDTTAYYNRSVYVTNRYVNGTGNRTYLSVYTRRGGAWLGFISSRYVY